MNSLASGKFSLYLYGHNEEKMKKMASDLQFYLPKKNVFSPNQNEEEFFSQTVTSLSPICQDLMFINTDDMKRNPIRGDEIENIYRAVQHATSNNRSSRKERSFILMFNRYLDSPANMHYLGEAEGIKGLSIFQSFNPGNSDAFYISKDAVEIVSRYVKARDDDFRKKLFKLVREGEIECFSFNPNLYILDLSSCEKNNNLQYLKSSIINYSSIMEKRNIDQHITSFFSDHIFLFWIFLVFFICSIFLFFLKVFKFGKNFL